MEKEHFRHKVSMFSGKKDQKRNNKAINIRAILLLGNHCRCGLCDSGKGSPPQGLIGMSTSRTGGQARARASTCPHPDSAGADWMHTSDSRPWFLAHCSALHCAAVNTAQRCSALMNGRGGRGCHNFDHLVCL